MAGGENCRENIGASKCWQGRTIENGEEEESERSQMAEHRRNTMSTTRRGFWNEDVHTSSIYQLRQILLGAASPPAYFAAVTDFTEMVSPLAVPVTVACAQASLLSLSNAA